MKKIALYGAIAKCVLALTASAVLFDARAESLALTQYSDPLVERYPANGLSSIGQAEAALRDAEEVRRQVLWGAYDRERRCATRFLSTGCMAEVNAERRTALAAVRQVEVASNRFIRRTNEAERNAARQDEIMRAQLEQAELAEQTASRRRSAEDQQTIDADAARGDADKAARRADAASKANAERAERAAEKQRAIEQFNADAPKRAENVRQYEQKQRDAAKRQAEVEQKKAERAAKKAADQAAKDSEAGNAQEAAKASGAILN